MVSYTGNLRMAGPARYIALAEAANHCARPKWFLQDDLADTELHESGGAAPPSKGHADHMHARMLRNLFVCPRSPGHYKTDHASIQTLHVLLSFLKLL